MPDLAKTNSPRSRHADGRRPTSAKDDATLPSINAWKSGSGEIPIASRFKGPGPAAYTVPSTFATPYVPNKAPAWTFGVRIQSKDNTFSIPGPGTFYPKVTRDGHSGGPAFSIQGRFRSVRHDGEIMNTPGPAAYNIKDAVANPTVGAPAYTMLGRTRRPKMDNNPGPAQYNIRTTIGTNVLTGSSSPANSILEQRTYKVASNSPGPAMYDTPDAAKRILKSAPAYSLGHRITRNSASGDSRLVAPGPANYSPTHRMKSRQAPSFSFGVRHSDFEAFVTGGEIDV